MKYTNILIHNDNRKLEYSSPIIVTFDFMNSQPAIGEAIINYNNGEVRADICAYFDIIDLYPCIVVDKLPHGTLFISELSMCKYPNFDSSILTIREQIEIKKTGLSDDDLDALYKDEGKDTDRYHR